MSEYTKATTESVVSKGTTDAQFFFEKYEKERLEKEILTEKLKFKAKELESCNRQIEEIEEIAIDIREMACDILNKKSKTKDELIEVISKIYKKVLNI